MEESAKTTKVVKKAKPAKTGEAKPAKPGEAKPAKTTKTKTGAEGKDPRANVIRVLVRMLPTPVKEEPVEEPEPVVEVAADPYEDAAAGGASAEAGDASAEAGDASAWYASANQAPTEDEKSAEDSAAWYASAAAPKDDAEAEVADSAAWYANANPPADDSSRGVAAFDPLASLEELKVDDKEVNKENISGIAAKEELDEEGIVKMPEQVGLGTSKDEKKEEEYDMGGKGEEGKEDDDMGEDAAGDDTVWDPQILVVRQGQVHIELQHRNPPMHDEQLKSFCNWLDKKLPVVVRNFPYVQKSGAYVDLSDNVIGPEGLDKLFQTLRTHRVPCVVMKAYRNVLDDTIVDTLIEYLYTQPEAYPMHGIHISHNNITDKGAFRLMRAAAQCGHYPRYTTRMPLWLRLECNDVEEPEKVVVQGNDEGFNMCLMQDGLCSRKNCNHYLDVHVQLPYFYHQGKSAAQKFDPTVGFGFGAPAKPSSPQIAAPPQQQQQERYTPYSIQTKSKTGPAQPPPSLGWQNGSGKGGWQQQQGGKGWNQGKGGGKDGGGWKGGGKDGGGWGKGGSKDGGKNMSGKGKGKWKTPLWSGPSLVSKRKIECKLSEGEFELGFDVTFEADGGYATVNYVDPSSSVGYAGGSAGLKLLRLNGLDCGILTEKQVRDLLKQRPLEIRMGDK